MGFNTKSIVGKQIFNGQTLAQNTFIDSEVIPAKSWNLTGSNSLHFRIAGTGVVDITIRQSNNYDFGARTGTFVQSTDAGSTVVTGFTENSGTDTDGEDIKGFTIPIPDAFFIRVRETNTGTLTSLEMWPSSQ